MSRLTESIRGAGPRSPWSTEAWWAPVERRRIRMPIGTHIARAIEAFHHHVTCRVLRHRWAEDTSYGQYPVHCKRCNVPDV